jgi:hypothetical protein
MAVLEQAVPQQGQYAWCARYQADARSSAWAPAGSCSLLQAALLQFMEPDPLPLPDPAAALCTPPHLHAARAVGARAHAVAVHVELVVVFAACHAAACDPAANLKALQSGRQAGGGD